jgi:stearoyl-CoA desaturase (delta-9 desaturase)
MRIGSAIDLADIDWVKAFIIVGVHAGCLGAFWAGASWNAIVSCAVMYTVRMFAISGGYHRYFALRSYRTSRVFHFVLGVLGCTTLQKGPLWWAAYHRHHHRHADQEGDMHSPVRDGFWWSHVGWIVSRTSNDPMSHLMQDFAQYREIRLLDQTNLLWPAILGVGCYLALGWQGVVWGFFMSTMLVYHATFSVNSLAHKFGEVRYRTTDMSRNSLVLAIVTLGEGWHNNHHYCATSARLGFVWWEIDVAYYILRLFTALGLVWDLKQPPQRVLVARSAGAVKG